LPQHHVVVVPHTHWDREWYRTHEQFRYALVRLVDRLLEILEGDPGFRHFTLDGQSIALDDYLEIRPHARERVAKLVRAGRILVGPWTVLPDEWLVSGEALVRNLRLGLARAGELGPPMRLGYVPDQFGHVGQLPQIFAGFGFPAAVLWRGVGRDVEDTTFQWEAPDGTRLFTVYLRNGYGNAVHLPLEPEALAGRLRAAIAALAPHSRIPSLLLMNGSDHMEPQPGLPAALEKAAALVPEATFELGHLPGFVARAREEAPEDLVVHRGELRSGLRSPLLPGCASARIAQKRRDFENDRLLTRYLEPLAAWLGELGGDPDPDVLEHLWRVALENHPHDSICGCSIDAVHEEMETRFARVRQLARAHLARVGREWANRVAAPAGRGLPLVGWNPGAGGRAQVDGVVEADVREGSRPLRLHLRGAEGRRVPVHATLEEPGRVLAEYRIPAHVAIHLARGFPPEFMGEFARAVQVVRDGDGLGVDLVMSADSSAGFDLEAAKRRVSERLSREGDRPVRFRARRLPRVRLRFVDELPGCGLATWRLARGRARPADAESELVAERHAGGARIANAVWEVEAGAEGRVTLRHRPTGTAIEDALIVASEGDRGDEYNFDPVPGDAPVARPASARVRLAPASEASAALEIDARYRVPAALAKDRAGRSARRVTLPVRVEIRLWEGLDRVDVAVRADNTARDHRLRLHLRAPFAARRLEVESAFEVAERPIAPGPEDFGSERPAERPIGATPQRSFATLVGDERALTVANRGAPEVEAVPGAGGTSALAVTLLRAVGWLSRDDLALRPGHAGPPLETPGAQVPGPHECELSLRLHPPGEAERAAEAHRFAAPPLLLAGGGGRGAPLADGARLVAVDDPAVVVSAVEPGRDGAAQVRLLNLSNEPRRVRVRWHGAARGLAAVDLQGRPDPGVDAEPEEGGVRLSLRPWQIATLRAG